MTLKRVDCGWIQQTDDELDWIRVSGNNVKSKSRPGFDHTTNTVSGYYFYMESSPTHVQGHTARMTSPLLQTGERELGLVLSSVKYVNYYLECQKNSHEKTQIFSSRWCQVSPAVVLHGGTGLWDPKCVSNSSQTKIGPCWWPVWRTGWTVEVCSDSSKPSQGQTTGWVPESVLCLVTDHNVQHIFSDLQSQIITMMSSKLYAVAVTGLYSSHGSQAAQICSLN